MTAQDADVVSFTPPPGRFNSRVEFRYQLNTRLGMPHSRSGRFREGGNNNNNNNYYYYYYLLQLGCYPVAAVILHV